MADLSATQQVLVLVCLLVVVWVAGSVIFRVVGAAMTFAGVAALLQGVAPSSAAGVLATGLGCWAVGHVLWWAQHGYRRPRRAQRRMLRHLDHDLQMLEHAHLDPDADRDLDSVHAPDRQDARHRTTRRRGQTAPGAT